MTQWHSNCKNCAPRKHPWPRTSQTPLVPTGHITGDTNQHNLLVCIASDMTGRDQGCLRGAGPGVFARCAVLAVRVPLCHAFCHLPDRKLSLTGVASLAEMSFCKAHRFLVCRRLASVKDCNRRSLDVGYSLWLQGLLLPGPGLPPGDGLVV